MKQNKNKEPLQETTKDNSSDVEKVKANNENTRADSAQGTKGKAIEDEEAEKGHA